MTSFKTHVVEFVGFPGSGKSTIVEAYVNHFDQNKQRDLNEAILTKNLYKNTLHFLLNYLRCALGERKLILFIVYISICNLKYLPHLLKRTHTLIIKLANIKYYFSSRQNSYLLLDQGVIQLIWSFVYKYNSEKKAKKHFNQLILILEKYLPNKVVYVNLDVTENSKRIISRNKKCDFKHYNLQQLIIIQVIFSNLINEFLENNYKGSVLNIDSSKSLEVSTKPLKNFIDS
jgi:thymidylate kinase